MTTEAYPSLPNAPIEEAIVDIHFNAPGFDVMQLGIADALAAEGFQEPKHIAVHEFHFDANPEAVKSGGRKVSVEGYRFDSKCGRYVVQCRGSSFTLSRLKPYENWCALKDRARQLWALYSAELPSFTLTRLAVRYVNLIKLPIRERLDFDDFLVNGPRTPNGCPELVNSWFERTEISFGNGTNAIVNQATKPPEVTGGEQVLPIILDIEVHRIGGLDLSEDEMWFALDELRQNKNAVFFGSITDATQELFR